MKPPNERDAVIARYKEGPALLESALSGLQDADLDALPAKGGWTIRQIVHHVVDGDDLWKLGIKIALGNEECEFTLDWYRTLPQTDWADRWAYAQRSPDVSLALLKATRAHILQLLEQVPDGWNRSVEFRKADGETMQVPVGYVVEMQANHVEHHVKQILALRKEFGAT